MRFERKTVWVIEWEMSHTGITVRESEKLK